MRTTPTGLCHCGWRGNSMELIEAPRNRRRPHYCPPPFSFRPPTAPCLVQHRHRGGGKGRDPVTRYLDRIMIDSTVLLLSQKTASAKKAETPTQDRPDHGSEAFLAPQSTFCRMDSCSSKNADLCLSCRPCMQIWLPSSSSGFPWASRRP